MDTDTYIYMDKDADGYMSLIWPTERVCGWNLIEDISSQPGWLINICPAG